MLFFVKSGSVSISRHGGNKNSIWLYNGDFGYKQWAIDSKKWSKLTS